MKKGNFCILGSFFNPKSSCLIDYWSIYHFYFTGFIYILLLNYFKVTKIDTAVKIAILLTIGHAIEEYLGNTSRISIEGVFIDNIGPLIDSKIKPENRKINNDTIYNSIGDVLSGVICCILIVFYLYRYKKLPYWFLYGIVIIGIMLYKKRKMLYD